MYIIIIIQASGSIYKVKDETLFRTSFFSTAVLWTLTSVYDASSSENGKDH